MFFWWDPTMLILIPGIIIAIWAQARVQSNYSRYAKVLSTKGYSGAQVARIILDYNGLSNVQIQHVRGSLTDHYDPRTKVVRLSDSVYTSLSLIHIS